MKCLFAVAFLALVAVTLAAPPQLVQDEKTVKPVETEDVKDVRDKRGVFVTSYATAPIAAPLAYAAYPAPVPYAYSSYVHPYPTIIGYSPFGSYIVA